jgi:hypothetical protein
MFVKNNVRCSFGSEKYLKNQLTEEEDERAMSNIRQQTTAVERNRSPHALEAPAPPPHLGLQAPADRPGAAAHR